MTDVRSLSLSWHLRSPLAGKSYCEGRTLPDWLKDVRSLRGSVLFDNGRRRHFRTEDGRFFDADPIDLFAYHILAYDGTILAGCVRVYRLASDGLACLTEKLLGEKTFSEILHKLGFGGGHGFGGSPGFFSGRGFSPDSSQSRGFSAGGLHGGKFQGRFAGDSSGSAFGMGSSARGGPHVFMGQGIGREFAFRHDDRFIDRDHRLFNRDQHHFFFDFDFAAFGFPSWTHPTSYPAVILFDDIVSRY